MQAVLITNYCPGSGKTVLALATAEELVKQGLRTLFVDASRDRSAGRWLGVAHDHREEQALVKTVRPGLSYTGAVDLPAVLDQLKSTRDVAVVDTDDPLRVSGVVAKSTGAVADMLFVVPARRNAITLLPRVAAVITEQRERGGRISVLGFVVTRVTEETQPLAERFVAVAGSAVIGRPVAEDPRNGIAPYGELADLLVHYREASQSVADLTIQRSKRWSIRAPSSSTGGGASGLHPAQLTYVMDEKIAERSVRISPVLHSAGKDDAPKSSEGRKATEAVMRLSLSSVSRPRLVGVIVVVVAFIGALLVWGTTTS